MNWNEFLLELLEKFIVAIPQLVASLTIIFVALKNLNKTVNIFPEKVDEQKKDFSKMEQQVNATLDEFATATDRIMNNAMETITNKVTNTMEGMQTELATYRENLQVVKGQMNLLLKENRAFVDIIIGLVSKNPELVKSGLSKEVTDMLNMTQEELKNYSSLIIDNQPLLETVLKEAMVNFDQEILDSVFGGLGYERNKTSEETQ